MSSTAPAETTSQNVTYTTTDLTIETQATDLVVALTFIFGTIFVGFTILGIVMWCRVRIKHKSTDATERNHSTFPSYYVEYRDSNPNYDPTDELHITTTSNCIDQHPSNHNVGNQSPSNEMQQNDIEEDMQSTETCHQEIGSPGINLQLPDKDQFSHYEPMYYYQSERAESPFAACTRPRSIDWTRNTPPELQRSYPINPVYRDSGIFHTGQDYYPDPKSEMNTDKTKMTSQDPRIYQQQWV